MKELGEGLWALKKIGTPQQDQQRQLIWTHGAFRTESPIKEHTWAGPRLLSCIYVVVIHPGPHVGTPKTGSQSVPYAGAYL